MWNYAVDNLFYVGRPQTRASENVFSSLEKTLALRSAHDNLQRRIFLWNKRNLLDTVVHLWATVLIYKALGRSVPCWKIIQTVTVHSVAHNLLVVIRTGIEAIRVNCAIIVASVRVWTREWKSEASLSTHSTNRESLITWLVDRTILPAVTIWTAVMVIRGVCAIIFIKNILYQCSNVLLKKRCLEIVIW